MSDDDATDAIRLWEGLKADRGTFEWHWQQVADYIDPDRADYTLHRAPGQKRMQLVYDTTPIWASQQCAAGFHSMLTSPFVPWMTLRAQDDRLDERDDVRAWMEDSTNRVMEVMGGASHNFATAAHELYTDIVNIGTGCMAVLESPRSGVLFSARHMSEVCIAENDEDRVDTAVRHWEYTARQAVAAWGPAAGPKAMELAEKKPDTKLKFLHSVKPRQIRDASQPDAMNMPFQSVYVALDDKHVIRRSGFTSFPYLTPRLRKSPGEVYGRGFGMTMLPDIRTLNEMGKTMLQMGQLIVRPPVQFPDDGYLVAPDLSPGARNPYRAGTRDRIETVQLAGDLPYGDTAVQAKRQAIIRGFYVDWLLMPTDPDDPAGDGKGITATYVLHRRDQQMQLMSPMVARLRTEFLKPLIDRTFDCMWRQSVRAGWGLGAMLTPPPAVLAGQPLRVEYVSPMEIAQRGSTLDGVMRLVNMATMLAQADPHVLGVIDGEETLRLTARDLNTPAAVLRTRQEVAQRDAAAQQAQQVMNAHTAAQGFAGAAADGATAVQRMAQAGQQQGQAA